MNIDKMGYTPGVYEQTGVDCFHSGAKCCMLIHPRQREGQKSWKDDVERSVLTAEH